MINSNYLVKTTTYNLKYQQIFMFYSMYFSCCRTFYNVDSTSSVVEFPQFTASNTQGCVVVLFKMVLYFLFASPFSKHPAFQPVYPTRGLVKVFRGCTNRG